MHKYTTFKLKAIKKIRNIKQQLATLPDQQIYVSVNMDHRVMLKAKPEEILYVANEVEELQRRNKAASYI